MIHARFAAGPSYGVGGRNASTSPRDSPLSPPLSQSATPAAASGTSQRYGDAVFSRMILRARYPAAMRAMAIHDMRTTFRERTFVPHTMSAFEKNLRAAAISKR